MGGTYTNAFDGQTSFKCFTNGSQQAPVIFRNYQNERPTIDGKLPYTLFCGLGDCSFTWFWGLEVVNSDTADRDHSNTDRLGNVYATAPNIKFINMVVHDLGSGLDSWKTASNSETHGCIIYNIGNNLRNGANWEGHGHGMYLQNDTIGTKRIHNNIIFSTYGYGMKVWQTTTTDAIGNFDIQRNIVFNGGAASENQGGVGNDSRTHNMFIVSNSVNNPIRNTVIKHNYTFAGVNIPRPPVNAFGLNYGMDNVTIDSNYLTCQTRLGFSNTPLFNASVNDNHIIAGIPAVYGYYLWGFTEKDYPMNTYVAEQPTAGLEYFVMPNTYEQGRSHLVVYNWSGAASVQVSALKTGLHVGDVYELIHAMDYYNDVIVDTLKSDAMITVPMMNHTLAPVIGSVKPPVSQLPIFGAFVIRRVGITATTGVSEGVGETPLNAFPNPSSGDISVRFTVRNAGFYDVRMTDVSGRTFQVRTKEFFEVGEQEIHIDARAYINSTYVVRIEGQQTSFVGTCVLQK